MGKQNIYDNQIFFENYKELRSKDDNANVLFEIPAFLSLLPEVQGLKVLDLGCGFGDHCRLLIDKGAKKVVGLDISQKMIEVAKVENNNSKIEYINLPMEDILRIGQKFDLVVSSLAFHYVEDFEKLVKDIYSILDKGGYLVFSQEHPLATSYSTGKRWTINDMGEKIYANISNYGREGERNIGWFVEGVKKYHRTFSTILNILIQAGFKIEKIIELVPNANIIDRYPEYNDLFHKPDFLLLKVVK